jgi:hypothetical protein
MTVDGERLIRAACTPGTITICQAYRPEIAELAVMHEIILDYAQRPVGICRVRRGR